MHIVQKMKSGCGRLMMPMTPDRNVCTEAIMVELAAVLHSKHRPPFALLLGSPEKHAAGE